MPDPSCKHCGGRGVVLVRRTPPAVRPCTCALEEEILANVERAFPGLSKFPPVESSPLRGREAKNVWVTARPGWFFPHLRHVGVRMLPSWSFRVSSDADLLTAWLATAVVEGQRIIDPDLEDAAPVSLTHLTLVDLATPPALLIVRLGVKQARNSAMNEVLLECLTLREHLGKPTWVWDQPDQPITNENHRCHSPIVLEMLSRWDRITEGEGKRRQQQADATDHQDALASLLHTPPSPGRKPAK